jgi:hypothetical protein
MAHLKIKIYFDSLFYGPQPQVLPTFWLLDDLAALHHLKEAARVVTCVATEGLRKILCRLGLTVCCE